MTCPRGPIISTCRKSSDIRRPPALPPRGEDLGMIITLLIHTIRIESNLINANFRTKLGTDFIVYRRSFKYVFLIIHLIFCFQILILNSDSNGE